MGLISSQKIPGLNLGGSNMWAGGLFIDKTQPANSNRLYFYGINGHANPTEGWWYRYRPATIAANDPKGFATISEVKFIKDIYKGF
jgi:hypothetical protein